MTIVIVGAGVSGLTTAVTLQEAGWTVRVIAEDIPGRTSLAAGAMWGPYLVEPWHKVREWSLTSLDAFRTIAADPNSGVRMTSGIEASRHAMPEPEWGELVPGFRACAPDELPAGFATGYQFAVPLIDMPAYLQHLRRRLIAAGGTLEVRKVESLDAISVATAIVNCAGLKAGKLAGHDEVRAIRGQLVVVENPGLTDFFSEDTGMSPDLVCIYPHGDTVVLGGTAIDGRDDLAEDAQAASAIVDRCASIEPRLKGARVIGHRVGIRPTRDQVRVEANTREDGTPVVHNYGHGGAGVTLSWGCARDVQRLIEMAAWAGGPRGV
ncbi:FAD-binding oxidoreductase [Streptomyces sp. TRM66268-LWL]|uniref:D-amino-acid oxidase n=1 Tax=Streptomyces polyasparticus TaxID=2767826 RepID=A0ABR7SV28_9ACTN|nr:FAD-dependent oxidoreductase [Streptomyces polyasparticus]MBC9719361.1 FAD-binding oxidoreductase [Streptomyces polyasparticus]